MGSLKHLLLNSPIPPQAPGEGQGRASRTSLQGALCFSRVTLWVPLSPAALLHTQPQRSSQSGLQVLSLCDGQVWGAQSAAAPGWIQRESPQVEGWGSPALIWVRPLARWAGVYIIQVWGRQAVGRWIVAPFGAGGESPLLRWESQDHYLHVPDGETEARQGAATGPRSPNRPAAGPGIEPRSSDSPSGALGTTRCH